MSSVLERSSWSDYADFFEGQFSDGGTGGGGGDIELPTAPKTTFGEKGASQEPFPTAHLVGRVALEDRVYALEERLHRGEELSQQEYELLHQTGEDLRGDYYR